MSHVAEIRGEQRIERLGNQLLHVAEPLNHRRGLFVVDMNDHAQGQHRFVGVASDQFDRFQRLVVVVLLGPARDPVQDEIGGGHQHDLARRRVEGVFSWAEGRFPNALLAFVDALAVAKFLARSVGPLLAVEADDHADLADGNDLLRNQLDRAEPAVEEVGAVDQRRILHAAAAAGGQKRLDILVVVVEVRLVLVGAHGGRDQFARGQGRTFMHGHDSDLIGLAADDQRAEAVQGLELLLPLFEALCPFQREDAIFGNHVEQRDVDGVDAFAEDAALAAFLAVAGQKLPCVLEVVALDDPGQGLRRHELIAAAGEDVADLPLLDGDQGKLVDFVLPAPESEMDAAAEDVGLVARLAVQGNDRALGQRAVGRPHLLDNADAVVGDEPDRQPQRGTE